MAMGEEEGEEQKQNIRVCKGNLNEKIHARQEPPKKYSCTSLKKSYKGNANEKNSCDFSIMVCP